MIGPQAYENLFQTSVDYSTKAVHIKHDGKRFIYYIQSSDWELFNSYDEFVTWCEADVQDNDGYYADTIEEVRQ